MQGTEEKPKSSLLQNMEMGNAAFWEQPNGEAAGAAPNGTANGEQKGAAAAGSETQQTAAQQPPAAAQQSECLASSG